MTGLLCVIVCSVVFFFKQKTAYEMRISDWSSDVCSSDLQAQEMHAGFVDARRVIPITGIAERAVDDVRHHVRESDDGIERRAELEIGRASCRERVCKYV